MRRLFVLTIVVVAAGLAFPAPAAAKGAESVSISGAGLAEAVTLTWQDDDMSRIAEQVRFYESVFEGAGKLAGGSAGAPVERLGPRLRMAWDMHHDTGAPGEDLPVAQDVYPFASGGPIVHTGADQEVYGAPVAEGWHRASRQLVVTLRRVGALPTRRATTVFRV